MHQSLSVQNNRYLKQANELPAGSTVSTQPYQSIPNYIPSVPAKNQVSTPYGAQKLANTVQPGVSTRKWEDIITNPTLTQTVLKTSESAVTFRSPTNARKLSNKELLAKADLILARSPKKFETVGISTQKETTTTSSNTPLYSTKSVQVLASPPPAYINTFASPVKVSMPLSYPTSVAREITSLQLNNYGIHENFKTSAPALNTFTPPQVLSPAYKQKLDEVVDKIIRREGGASPLRQETYAYKAPIEVQTITQHRPAPILSSAPQRNPYLNSQSSAAQRRLSELSEIQRDFLQLKIDSQKTQGLKDATTPTPFISGYGSNYGKGSNFAPELLVDDRDSVGYGDEHRLESDRESRKLYAASVPKKEARINRYINPNPKQQEAPRVFRLEEQSGRSQISRNPYRRPQSQSREGEFIAVSKPRELTPENYEHQIISEGFRGVKQTTERNRITSSEYMVERQEDQYEIRRSIAMEEEFKRRNQQEQMVSLSEREKQVMASPKSEGVVLSSPSHEYTTRRPEESGDNWRRERINKYSNKVEVSVDVRPELVGKGKQPRVMSKTEKFFG